MHYEMSVSVYVSSERETATAKYVGVNKLIRDILIEIATFCGTFCIPVLFSHYTHRSYSAIAPIPSLLFSQSYLVLGFLR